MCQPVKTRGFLLITKYTLTRNEIITKAKKKVCTGVHLFIIDNYIVQWAFL